MPFAWRPVPGQVALIEVPGVDECLTGVVIDEPGEDEIVIDLGASPRPPSEECEVVASFFAPDALYRLRATATPDGRGSASVIDLRIHQVERIQRRSSQRARIEVPAVLSNFDDPGELVSVRGETRDIGEGGCCVRTDKPFPAGADPTVTLALPDGNLVALGAILQAATVEGGYEYRIVFLEIDDADRPRLTQLVESAAAA